MKTPFLIAGREATEMSYILDALRKIEQKRDRDDPLRKATFSGELPPEPKKRALWPYVLLTLLLLNAVVITFLVSSPKTDKGSTSAVARAPVPSQPAIVTTTEDGGAIREKWRDQKEALPRKDVVPPSAQTAEKENKESVAPAPAKPLVTERPPAGSRTGHEKVTAPASDRVFSLSELPSAIRSGLPEFKVSGHAYSADRQNRVTRVNEKILQEGQELAPGLRVEEITPEGIVFSYQGYRIRVGVDGNR
jgi:general secretion pathway protein B